MIDEIDLDRELVFHFFALFSRFECALKRTAEFLDGDEKGARANWEKYANSLHGQFGVGRSAEFREAVACLLAKPPKKQVVVNGVLCWHDSVRGDGECSEAFVLRLVRTIRNNLFHGGKYPYPDGPVDEVAKNRRFLEASRTLLLECLELSPQVAQLYEAAA